MTHLHAATVFLAFFAIMNPLANVPVFVSLTSDDDAGTTRAVAFRSVALAFAIIAIFAIAGKLIFELFGITLPAFRITGGLIILLIGFQMLRGKQSVVHHPDPEEQQKSKEAALSVAVCPLAMPLLAGPGTIATAMNFAAGGGLANVIVTIIAFGMLCAVTFVVFVFGQKFIKFIGAGALAMITRMMGLILATIGVQMTINGLGQALKVGS